MERSYWWVGWGSNSGKEDLRKARTFGIFLCYSGSGGYIPKINNSSFRIVLVWGGGFSCLRERIHPKK